MCFRYVNMNKSNNHDDNNYMFPENDEEIPLSQKRMWNIAHDDMELKEAFTKFLDMDIPDLISEHQSVTKKSNVNKK